MISVCLCVTSNGWHRCWNSTIKTNKYVDSDEFASLAQRFGSEIEAIRILSARKRRDENVYTTDNPRVTGTIIRVKDKFYVDYETTILAALYYDDYIFVNDALKIEIYENPLTGTMWDLSSFGGLGRLDYKLRKLLAHELALALSSYGGRERLDEDYKLRKLLADNLALAARLGNAYRPLLPAEVSTTEVVQHFDTSIRTESTFAPPVSVDAEDPRSFAYPSANMPFPELIPLKPLMLPIFRGVSPETVRRIRRQETDAFHRFYAMLRKNLVKLSKSESAATISEIIADMEEEIAKLELEARKVMRQRYMSEATLALTALSIAGVVCPDLTQLHNVSMIVGGASLFSAMQSIAAHRNAKDTMRQSGYYIPFLLDKNQAGR
jgi:hypothetical protein